MQQSAIMKEVRRHKASKERWAAGRIGEVQWHKRKKEKGHISPLGVIVVSYGVQEAIALNYQLRLNLKHPKAYGEYS